ncbi:hypothetical protein CH304_17325 [Rhodococcus sp. 15-649-1-2]|nr:hypothetical protein CH282_25830 [Rhodococcus sp. 06-418-1B]OZE80158.1 hypothetical protein CH304_17325 [Rhodococcus sp. 15-649-1-2]
MTLSTFADLKATWGIAIKALVVRFQQLGIVSSDQATSLYKQISKRGWNKSEPVPTTNEEPVWFSKALNQRVGGRDAAASIAVASQMTGLSNSHFTRWVDWTPASTNIAEVVNLQPGEPTASRTSTGSASILTFSGRHDT